MDGWIDRMMWMDGWMDGEETSFDKALGIVD
jgi:hypothetical protein